MKLKVVKPFHDKETDELYNVGSIIEVTEKRGKEILASKYEVAEKVEEEKTEEVEKPAPKKKGKKTDSE